MAKEMWYHPEFVMTACGGTSERLWGGNRFQNVSVSIKIKRGRNPTWGNFLWKRCFATESYGKCHGIDFFS